jgi:hypothetical protein
VKPISQNGRARVESSGSFVKKSRSGDALTITKVANYADRK